ncbi:hypothetical protein GSI_09582 [Ganoderma sinense ZZ0214-1]|uniref:Uncharacterized protein n=1 Tax=Ganoderma sinense ZZ0214-1 TaxID=1077348 RepID=A0A2G8S3G8_9APHY|nr:hypothetical protein GSI_09582 [Ganoderma sinense ZZ0214-1]
MSTGIYVAALIWNRWEANHLVSGAMDGLFSPSYDGRREMAAFDGGMRKQFSMAVFGLEINWILGDAIVWWRACVIWRTKAVYCIGPVLVACTLGLPQFFLSALVSTTGLALLEVYNPFLEVFAIFSLATNVLATSLIAYKAWEHRRFVKKYFSQAGTKSQVLKTLALLVESGSVYCALMIFIIVYYTREKLVPSESPAGDAGLVFTKVGGTYFVYGCIGPLVAIYPTIIVFLIALKQSPIDNGVLSQVYQAHHERLADDPSPGLSGDGGVKSTLVFQDSTFQTQSSAGGDMGDSTDVEGMAASDCRIGSTRSLTRGSSMGDSRSRHGGKVIDSLV